MENKSRAKNYTLKKLTMKQNAISIQSLKKTYPNGFEALK